MCSVQFKAVIRDYQKRPSSRWGSSNKMYCHKETAYILQQPSYEYALKFNSFLLLNCCLLPGAAQ
jgi:hypothetical protein